MKDKLSCEIVQDLLPSYIDELTSEYTKMCIDEHLKECTACQEVIKQMTPKIKTKEINEPNLFHFKKFLRKIKIVNVFYGFFIAVVVTILLVVGHETLILGNPIIRIPTNMNILYSGDITLDKYVFNESCVSEQYKSILLDETDDKQELFDEINNWKVVQSNIIPSLCHNLYTISWEGGHIMIAETKGKIYINVYDDKIKKTTFYELTKGDISILENFQFEHEESNEN